MLRIPAMGTTFSLPYGVRPILGPSCAFFTHQKSSCHLAGIFRPSQEDPDRRRFDTMRPNVAWCQNVAIDFWETDLILMLDDGSRTCFSMSLARQTRLRGDYLGALQGGRL